MPSSSRRRRGGRRRGRPTDRNPPTPAPPVEERDWAELPLDVISALLHKLDTVEILMGAGLVCRSWLHVACDEPELWRRIDMRGHAAHFNKLDAMAREAVRRSQGRCEAFSGESVGDSNFLLPRETVRRSQGRCESVGDNNFLLYLGDQAPSLKSLRLISCYSVSDEGLTKTIDKFPLLEELELSLCPNVRKSGVFEAISKGCPQLRRFRLSKQFFLDVEATDCSKDEVALWIANMRELRSLQLFANILTNKGLRAILENCRHLESLDIRHCFNVEMDDTLRAKCARIVSLKLPFDSTDGYEFEVYSPVYLSSESGTDESAYYCSSDLEPEDYDDYCDPSRYLDGVYEEELDEDDRKILMGMRALTK